MDNTPKKEHWPDGPWTNEPDREEFRHAGMDCLLRRGPVGAWCGYVAVPPGHPLHGKHYDDAPVEVHGGLTYAEACQGEICHVPAPGEPDDVWWLGFDGAHSGDLCPAMEALRRPLPTWVETLDASGRRAVDQLAEAHRRLANRREEYRDIAYVRAETQRLAEQLAEVGRC